VCPSEEKKQKEQSWTMEMGNKTEAGHTDDCDIFSLLIANDDRTYLFYSHHTQTNSSRAQSKRKCLLAMLLRFLIL